MLFSINHIYSKVTEKFLSQNKLVYVGHVYTSVVDIKGPHIHTYYIIENLEQKKKTITLLNIPIYTNKIRDIISLFSCNTIWLSYPCGRLGSTCVVLSSYLLNKELIVYVNDFPYEQAKDLKSVAIPFTYKVQTKLLEKLLFYKASVIILPSPGFLSYMNPRTSNIIIFPFGISADFLSKKNPSKKDMEKIITYAGSLDRGGMIEKISCMFSKIPDWNLWIAGEGSERIYNSDNVTYFGTVSFNEVQDMYGYSDAIIIPYPNKPYFKNVIPLKLAEVLATCKPVITLKLPCIEKYVKYIGLENNVIYVDDWNLDEILKALNKIQNLQINIDDTLSKIKKLDWEARIKKLVELIDEDPSKIVTSEWL